VDDSVQPESASGPGEAPERDARRSASADDRTIVWPSAAVGQESGHVAAPATTADLVESGDEVGRPEPAQAPSLADVIADGPLEPPRALELLTQVADALDDAHVRGVVHPNLEPASVLIDVAHDDRAVLDFSPDSASRSLEGGHGRPAASLQYVSPEQILGQAVQPRSNVYSLSALLYRCLTGSVPFPGGRDQAVLFWHLHAPRPRATDVRPELPAAIDPVLARGMAIDPAERHPTAGALVGEAREAMGLARAAEPAAWRPAVAVAMPSSAGRAGAVKRGGGVRRSLARLGVVALAVAAAGAGFAIAGAFDDPTPPWSSAKAGGLELAAPADWRRLRTAAVPAGLRLSDPLVLAPSASREARLIAGIATPAATGALLAQLRASPPHGEPVSLGRVQARRYQASSMPGLNGPVTMYVAPMDHGVATVACLAGRAPVATSFMSRCERVAASLHLANARFTPVGPSDRQATGLGLAFRRLNAARSRYRSRLARSKAVAVQATAARAVADAHAREARVLGALDLTGLAEAGGTEAIQALRRAATAYRAAASAAHRGNRRGYAAARRSAVSAGLRIERAQRLLRAVGYVA
jgi:Protein kinase domain